jgi:hypothetical protein
MFNFHLLKIDKVSTQILPVSLYDIFLNMILVSVDRTEEDIVC